MYIALENKRKGGRREGKLIEEDKSNMIDGRFFKQKIKNEISKAE